MDEYVEMVNRWYTKAGRGIKYIYFHIGGNFTFLIVEKCHNTRQKFARVSKSILFLPGNCLIPSNSQVFNHNKCHAFLFEMSIDIGFHEFLICPIEIFLN